MIIPISIIIAGAIFLYGGISNRSIVELLVGHHPAKGTGSTEKITGG